MRNNATRIAGATVVGVGVLLLSGCGTTCTGQMYVKGGSGGVSEAKVGATCKPSSAEAMLVALAVEYPALSSAIESVLPEAVLMDAYLMKVDTRSSNTTLAQTSGTVVVTLKQGTANLATRSFPWKKSGYYMIFSDPASVNAWTAQYPAADGYSYDYTANYTTVPNIKVVAKDMYNQEVVFTQVSEAGPGCNKLVKYCGPE